MIEILFWNKILIDHQNGFHLFEELADEAGKLAEKVNMTSRNSALILCRRGVNSESQRFTLDVKQNKKAFGNIRME